MGRVTLEMEQRLDLQVDDLVALVDTGDLHESDVVAITEQEVQVALAAQPARRSGEAVLAPDQIGHQPDRQFRWTELEVGRAEDMRGHCVAQPDTWAATDQTRTP